MIWTTLRLSRSVATVSWPKALEINRSSRPSRRPSATSVETVAGSPIVRSICVLKPKRSGSRNTAAEPSSLVSPVRQFSKDRSTSPRKDGAPLAILTMSSPGASIRIQPNEKSVARCSIFGPGQANSTNATVPRPPEPAVVGSVVGDGGCSASTVRSTDASASVSTASWASSAVDTTTDVMEPVGLSSLWVSDGTSTRFHVGTCTSGPQAVNVIAAAMNRSMPFRRRSGGQRTALAPNGNGRLPVGPKVFTQCMYHLSIFGHLKYGPRPGGTARPETRSCGPRRFAPRRPRRWFGCPKTSPKSRRR